MFNADKHLRNHLAAALGRAVDELSAEHFPVMTQEPQLSARIGQRIESDVRGLKINGYIVDVITQDFSDRGGKALEKPTGTDLYIGISVRTKGCVFAKGLLIQSKWQLTLGIEGQKNLEKQCREMIKRSDKGSFVWSYGPNAVEVTPASEVIISKGKTIDQLSSKGATEFFTDVLDCFSGDQKLVPAGGLNDRRQLGIFLEELRVPNGVAVNVEA